MKCPIPECGAATEVLSTRMRADGIVIRRRVCFNEHRFSTREQVSEKYAPDNNRSSSEQTERTPAAAHGDVD